VPGEKKNVSYFRFWYLCGASTRVTYLDACINSEMFVVELMKVAVSLINSSQQEEPQCNGQRMKASRSEKESDHTVNDVHRFKVRGSKESANEGRKSSEAHCFTCGCKKSYARDITLRKM